MFNDFFKPCHYEAQINPSAYEKKTSNYFPSIQQIASCLAMTECIAFRQMKDN